MTGKPGERGRGWEGGEGGGRNTPDCVSVAEFDYSLVPRPPLCLVATLGNILPPPQYFSVLCAYSHVGADILLCVVWVKCKGYRNRVMTGYGLMVAYIVVRCVPIRQYVCMLSGVGFTVSLVTLTAPLSETFQTSPLGK